MNKALLDKRASEIVKRNPPIVYEPSKVMIGYPVWCGNEVVKEYEDKQDEEWSKNHDNRLHGKVD